MHFFATIKSQVTIVFFPGQCFGVVVFLFGICCFCVWICATHCCFYVCHMHILFLCSAHQQACIQKQGPSFLQHPHDTTVSETAVWHLYAIPALVENLFSLSLSVLLWFPFQNTVFMTAVNLQKTLFSYWSGSFWFGLTAKTTIGTCGALQCTFHTALTKSCKRDWFRGGLASVLASRYEIILVSAFQSHWENSHQQMAGQTFKVSLFSYSAHLFDV